MAIISLEEPHRIPDLISYQSLFTYCQEGRWIVNARQLRLKALAVSTTEWSCINISMWKLAFPKYLLAPDLYQSTKALPFKPPQ